MLPSASDRVALLDTCGLTDQAGRSTQQGVVTFADPDSAGRARALAGLEVEGDMVYDD